MKDEGERGTKIGQGRREDKEVEEGGKEGMEAMGAGEKEQSDRAHKPPPLVLSRASAHARHHYTDEVNNTVCPAKHRCIKMITRKKTSAPRTHRHAHTSAHLLQNPKQNKNKTIKETSEKTTKSLRREKETQRGLRKQQTFRD